MRLVVLEAGWHGAKGLAKVNGTPCSWGKLGSQPESLACRAGESKEASLVARIVSGCDRRPVSRLKTP